MLVAEKREYLESYYPHIQKQERENKKTGVRPKPEQKFRKKVFPIIMVMIGFAAASLTISRYAVIAENQSRILVLEKNLEKEMDRQGKLKLELAYKGDLKRIEEYARNNLNMDYPGKDQVLFVELPKNSEETPSQVQVAQQEESLWDKIANLID